MRILLALALLAAASSASAQAPSQRVLDSLRKSFPAEHSALAARLRGQSPEAARRILSEALDKFAHDNLDSILAAPGGRLIAIEARHGAMLRSLEARDLRLCAMVGDRGFFSPEARAGAPAEGLDDYAVALIEAAAEGRGRAAPQPAVREDYAAWLDSIERREPNVPVRAMLVDREVRLSAGDRNLCVGAALMHEAASALPPDQAARVSAMLVKSILGVPRAAP